MLGVAVRRGPRLSFSSGQCLGTRAPTRSAWDACGAWAHACTVWPESVQWPEREWLALGVCERSTGPHLYAPFAALVTSDRGHRAPRAAYVFQMYVSYVLSGCCICCNSYTRILQLCFSNVSAVSSRCCMFSSGCCICCSGYTRMLQVYIPKFTYFRRSCKCFYLDVAYVAVVIHICCKCMFQLFHLVLSVATGAAPHMLWLVSKHTLHQALLHH